MVKNFNIAKIWKLLIIIPAVLLLFACSGVEGDNSAVDQTQDGQELEIRHRECWQASVVGAIYDTTSHITMGMYSHMTQGAMALMMVAFAVWLAFRIMRHVSSFTEESPAEVWTEVMKKFFLCFICGMLATSTTGVIWVLNSLIFPIYNAFLELGSEMLGYFAKNPGGGSATATANYSIGAMGLYIPFEGTVEAKYNAACTVAQVDAATPESFPLAPKQMMECMICAVNERLNFGFKLGWVIITQPGFMALICGLIMLCLFTFIKLGFVFYLVDSVFRFALMVLMMPIFIMAYAFKPTRKWTTTAFATILNSAAFMMCIAIVILMAMAAIQQILVDNKDLIEGDKTSLTDFSKPMLMLLLVGFLLVGAMDIAKSIADSLVGGKGDTNFQKRIGAALFKTGKWAVMGAVTGGAGLALANSAKLRALNGKFQGIKSKLGALAGDDDDEDES